MPEADFSEDFFAAFGDCLDGYLEPCGLEVSAAAEGGGNIVGADGGGGGADAAAGAVAILFDEKDSFGSRGVGHELVDDVAGFVVGGAGGGEVFVGDFAPDHAIFWFPSDFFEDATPEFELAEGFGFVDVLDDFLLAGAFFYEVGGEVEAAGCGIGMLEAAGVGDDAREKECGDVGVEEYFFGGDFEFGDDAHDDFGAAGCRDIDNIDAREAGIAGVVVDIERGCFVEEAGVGFEESAKARELGGVDYDDEVECGCRSGEWGKVLPRDGGAAGMGYGEEQCAVFYAMTDDGRYCALGQREAESDGIAAADAGGERLDIGQEAVHEWCGGGTGYGDVFAELTQCGAEGEDAGNAVAIGRGVGEGEYALGAGDELTRLGGEGGGGHGYKC